MKKTGLDRTYDRRAGPQGHARPQRWRVSAGAQRAKPLPVENLRRSQVALHGQNGAARGLASFERAVRLLYIG